MFIQKKFSSLGVIGGLGPQATLYYCNNLIQSLHNQFTTQNTPIPIIYLSMLPGLDYLSNKTPMEKSIPLINSIFKTYKKQRVDLVVAPCNTLNAFLKTKNIKSTIPFIDIIEETVKELISQKPKKVGILGTKWTIDSEIYQKPLRENGIDLYVPEKNNYQQISNFIYDVVKNGVTAKNSKKFLNIILNFLKSPSDIIVLGCTEFCLFSRPKGVNTINSLDVLINSTLDYITNSNK